jgi:archaellum component FlaC
VAALRVLALVVQASPAPEPFFTNDAEGMVRVFLFFGSIVLGSIGAIYKVMYGPHRERVDRIADDLDRVGAKINGLSNDGVSMAERVRSLETGAQMSRDEMSRIHVQLGALQSDVRQMIDESHDIKVDIISAVTDSKRDLTAQITESVRQQAERDSRISQRIMRLETIAEMRGIMPRDPTQQEGV